MANPDESAALANLADILHIGVVLQAEDTGARQMGCVKMACVLLARGACSLCAFSCFGLRSVSLFDCDDSNHVTSVASVRSRWSVVLAVLCCFWCAELCDVCLGGRSSTSQSNNLWTLFWHMGGGREVGSDDAHPILTHTTCTKDSLDHVSTTEERLIRERQPGVWKT